MSGWLRFRLDDGRDLEATFEGDIAGTLAGVLEDGYVGNKMRLGSAGGSAPSGNEGLAVRLFDEDDTEGHALRLRLPDAADAAALDERLRAAGQDGVTLIRASTT